jgi:hypothetical protein
MQGWRTIFIQTADRKTDRATRTGQDLKNEQELSRWAALYRQIGGHLDKVPRVAATYRWLRRNTYEQILRRSAERRRLFVDLDDNAARHNVNPCVTLSKTARPRAMAELANRIGFDDRIRHVRDAQYFSWRFQNPLSEYRFLFWQDRRLDGFLVLHVKVYPHSDDEWAYIVDWEAVNQRVWNELLQAAIQWGNFNSISMWSANLSEEMKTRLREAGFAFKDKTGSALRDIRGENILIKPLCRETKQSEWVLAGRNLLDPTHWDLRMIYSDAY